MSFAAIYEKSQNAAFRNRLTVALIEQCRWVLQSDQSEGLQRLARVLRAQSTNKDELTRIAIYTLLPWGSFDPEDDSALQTKVAQVFPELGGEPLPAE